MAIDSSTLATLCGAAFLLAAMDSNASEPEPRPQLDRAKLPGRQVRVAAICIGYGGEHEAKMKLAISHLETAGRQGVDIALLPEEFAGTTAEPIPGPTTNAIAELARCFNMYIVCPIREQAGEEQFNTAVLIDRQGKVAGTYRKVFVFWGEGLHVSRDGVKVFDTDFGRISILTCFDLNFAELWQEAEKLGAEIVFWPSAYGGGLPLNGNAMLHGYYIVPAGAGNIVDFTGETLAKVERPRGNQFIATLDLDRTLIHHNFTAEKVARLLKEHKGEVEMERDYPMEEWFLLRSAKPGIRVRDLCREYQIETLREYRQRSRDQINDARKTGKRI
jgi:beta-ureidopropionase